MPRLSLKIVKWVFLGITVLLCVLMLLAWKTYKMSFVYATLIVCLVAVLFGFLFWRCPYCGKYLGKGSGKFCNRCGTRIKK